jgi:hypothetical protein
MTCQFVVQQLYGHIAHEDVRANFLFHFFNILKYIKYVFQNIGSICSHELKYHLIAYLCFYFYGSVRLAEIVWIYCYFIIIMLVLIIVNAHLVRMIFYI